MRKVSRLCLLTVPLGLGAAASAPAALGVPEITNPLVADFGEVTLNGTVQSRTAALGAFSVTDSDGFGWNVTVQATPFREYAAGAYVAGGKTLPAGSLVMAAPTVTAVGTTSPAPTILAGAPWTIDAGAAVKIASAAVDEGVGTYEFSSVNLTLTVPASAYARTYRSDVTVSAAAGP